MTRAEHAEALLDATRGSVTDHIHAVIAADRGGHSDLMSIDEGCWAAKVNRLIDACEAGDTALSKLLHGIKNGPCYAARILLRASIADAKGEG